MKRQKKERSIWNIFFTTYKTFVTEKTGICLLMALLSLLPALVSPVKVYLERSIFDAAQQVAEAAGVEERIYRIFLVFMAVQFLYVAVYPLFRCHVNYFGSEFETVLQNNMNYKTAKISLINYERSELYKDIDLASSASRELRFMTMMFSSELLLYLFQFLAVSTVLFTFHPALVAIAFLALAPDIFARFLKSKWQYRLVDRVQPVLRRKKYYESVLTVPQNIKETRVCRNASWFLGLWEKEREEYHGERWAQQKKNTVLDLINQLVNVLTVMLTYGIVVWLVLRGDITVGAFGASIGAVNTLKSNFGRICDLAMFSFQCGLKGKYYYKVLDYEERGGEERNGISAQAGIRFADVHFSYTPWKEALSGISFDVRPGESVAVVGENGSGKTTMVKMLLGLYRPDSGEVYYGRDEIGGIREDCIYRDASAVFQDFCRYALTLQENVAISDSGAPIDEARIQDLLKSVSFWFGSLTPDAGLGREFGGAELSGGNWQKLAIARGLYKAHHVIAFDEPTAALDPLVEEQILHSMLKLDPESIKIFVTHRLSTARFVDKIIVMKEGRIVGCGTHEQLINQNPVYTKLWNAQAKWYST